MLPPTFKARLASLSTLSTSSTEQSTKVITTWSTEASGTSRCSPWYHFKEVGKPMWYLLFVSLMCSSKLVLGSMPTQLVIFVLFSQHTKLDAGPGPISRRSPATSPTIPHRQGRISTLAVCIAAIKWAKTHLRSALLLAATPKNTPRAPTSTATPVAAQERNSWSFLEGRQRANKPNSLSPTNAMTSRRIATPGTQHGQTIAGGGVGRPKGGEWGL
mmetsp:Transcript_33406/g.74832  ORF Transcript_33406/g.74832 Transcript_33406/m.74832 type:complete len:216 (-) Transcript_33406:11-658(-)